MARSILAAVALCAALSLALTGCGQSAACWRNVGSDHPTARC